jgi:predicted DNA-binding ribbon-helix-helix protein
MWCRVVTGQRKRPPMREQRSQGKRMKAQRKAAIRASITFPSVLYKALEEIAQEKKVSLAWVVRDAAEKYVAEPSKPGNTRPRS